MRKSHRDLPFECPNCGKGFNSRGDLRRHSDAVHRVTVHSLADIASAGVRPRQELTFGQGVIAIVLSLASAGFYAALVRFGFHGLDLPVWSPFLVAQLAGLVTGICYLLTKRHRKPKSVAHKQQKAA